MCYPISRCPAPRSSSSCSICTSKQVKFLEIHRSPRNHCFHYASIVEPSTEVLRPSSAHSVLKMTRRRRRRCPQQIFEPQQFDGGNVQSFRRELGKMWAPCQMLLAKFCHKSHWKVIRSTQLKSTKVPREYFAREVGGPKPAALEMIKNLVCSLQMTGH